MKLPDDPQQRLEMLRQQLAASPVLSDLLKAVCEDSCKAKYQSSHNLIAAPADLSHTLGEARGISTFVKSITSPPSSQKAGR